MPRGTTEARPFAGVRRTNSSARKQLQQCLHARSASGEWFTSIDATLWSWRAAGVGRWVAPLAWRPLRPLFLLAYKLFSLARPHLAWLPHPDGSRRCKGVCPSDERGRH
nr:hypothetical protein [Azotobacter chroococcum]